MKFQPNQIEELNLILQFDLSSTANGIKVHSDALPAIQTAVQNLFEKGLCTQPDGGYLTHEGIELAECIHKIHRILD
ncbi:MULTISPECIES: TIGR02647 family protein [Vibrio]|uniref:TIGR02647 family protein n=2 Tax=Vibrio TaxID=662 RepID=A0A7X4LNE6_9VIBR|nr:MULTISPECIES: TIGR02647 family protein [Vibrio]MBF9000748.1 TIGR02647 family protein [Vibrio nitrifigilis]MZI95188.1 TIGR02647 family protein [Vibrio eleionomae]